MELACNIVEIKFFVWLISEKQKQHVRLIDIEYNHLQNAIHNFGLSHIKLMRMLLHRSKQENFQSLDMRIVLNMLVINLLYMPLYIQI